MTDRDEIVAEITASTGRRLLGLVSLWSLTGLLLYIAVAENPALEWRIFLVLLAAASGWLAEQMRRATAMRLELTREELRDSTGRLLVRVEDVVAVDRGMFAFKPSNGFLMKTAQPAKAAFHPGMWWRTGRRIGIGGMTPGAQAKTMADILSAMVEERKLEG